MMSDTMGESPTPPTPTNTHSYIYIYMYKLFFGPHTFLTFLAKRDITCLRHTHAVIYLFIIIILRAHFRSMSGNNHALGAITVWVLLTIARNTVAPYLACTVFRSCAIWSRIISAVTRSLVLSAASCAECWSIVS